MKVLVISGSPRIGGNSDVLCDQFIKGAKEAGHETEKINQRTKISILLLQRLIHNMKLLMEQWKDSEGIQDAFLEQKKKALYMDQVHGRREIFLIFQ